MISIYVLDTNADSRRKLVDDLSLSITNVTLNSHSAPNVNLKPLANTELRFNKAPDICIIGPNLIEFSISEISNIKKLLPQTPLIACVSENNKDLSLIEHLARLGADDIMSSNVSGEDFFQKVLLLSKRGIKKTQSQLLIVDAGKGGLGVSSLVSGIGEYLAENDKKVLLIDLDTETQDLSRFLQVRPFVNENLNMLLDENRPIVSDFVEQCYVNIWEDLPNLFCMSPVADSSLLYDNSGSYPRLMLSLLESLDQDFDYIIVDMASSRGGIFDVFFKVADQVLLLLGSDPASLYATSARLKKLREVCHSQTKIKLCENLKGLPGAFSSVLRNDFSRVAGVKNEEWIEKPLNYCKRAKRWPGSGSSLYGQASLSLKHAISTVCFEMNLIDKKTDLFFQGLFSKLFKPKFRKDTEKEEVLNSMEGVEDSLPAESGKIELVKSPKLISYKNGELSEKISFNLVEAKNSFEFSDDNLVSSVKIN